MKYTVILIFFLCLNPVVFAKSEKNVVMESSQQFQRWCKKLSYIHFRRKQQQPYNWSASTIRQLNDYQTRGSWKVGNVEQNVFCKIHIGKKAKFTKIEIYPRL